jgi:hypothetical protein
MVLLLVEAPQALLDRLGAGLDVEGVFGNFPRDTRYFYWTLRKYVFVASEEVNEHAFLFGV